MNSKKLKIASAALGASAVVAMGALTAVLSSDTGSATVVSGPEMTLGETSTIEKAATSPRRRWRCQRSRPKYLTASGRNP